MEGMMDEYRDLDRTSRSRRDIEFLIMLRLEFRRGMQDDLVPGGMEKLLRISKMIPISVTELLRDYKSLPINVREERLTEAGEKMKQEVMARPGTSPYFLSSKVRYLEEWLKSHHDLAGIERETGREKDRAYSLVGDESLGGYRPYSATQERSGKTTTQLRREQIQQFQDELRTSLDNTPWF
jgi:hypothetical protein